MELCMDLVKSLTTVNQMTIGRNHARYSAILAMPTKTASDLSELETLKQSLQPYSTNPVRKMNEPTNSKATERAAQTSIVLNQSKLASANLTGAQSLEVHRASVALGRLMAKPAEHLTIGEKADLALLKARLLRFVGMEGYVATDNDFRVVS